MKLDKGEEEQRVNKERMAQQKGREVESQEIKFRTLLQKELDSRKENENVFKRVIEERAQGVKQDLSREQFIRQESLNEIATCAESDINKLNEDLQC